MLSEKCDRILAVGKEDNGDVYELVANGQTSYKGITNKIGVIKNNKWLVPLSDKNPMLKKGKLIVPKDLDKDEYVFTQSVLDDEETVINKYKQENGEEVDTLKTNLAYCEFNYLDNGCFLYTANCEYYPFDRSEYDLQFQENETMLVYNSLNNKVFNLYKHRASLGNHSLAEVGNNKYFVLEKYETLYSLNIDKMKMKKITSKEIKDKEFSEDDISGRKEVYYSNGLIYYRNYKNKKENGFYNINGKRVIDLSMYKIQDTSLYFSGDQCTFQILNDANQKYKITIDKKGKVIKDERV